MRRKPSMMGSSKYEFDPQALDRDINERKQFFNDCVLPQLKQKIYAITQDDEFLLNLKKQHTGSATITTFGIKDYIESYILEKL